MAWHGKQKKIGLIYVVAVLLSSSGVPAAAQDPEMDAEPMETESTVPDMENGLTLTHKLCTSCHLTGGEQTEASTPVDVPSFPSIANRPNQSAQALANWLVAPHAPMPDPQLTRKEIRDLAAYILSLKSNAD